MNNEIRGKIDKIWLTFHSAGVSVPHVVVAQITNLMFIRDLDDLDSKQEADYQLLGIPFVSKFSGQFESYGTVWDKHDFKWRVFIDFAPEKQVKTLTEGVFPFIKQLHGDKESAYARYMSDAKLEVDRPAALSDILNQMDSLYELIYRSDEKDIKGDVYEYILSKMATSGINGQFRTPRHIIDMMVKLRNPTSDDIICDPACGTAGFLIGAFDYIKEKEGMTFLHNPDKRAFFDSDMFNGLENDSNMIRIAAMNLIAHGIDNPNLRKIDSLTDENPYRDTFSMIFANPPFTSSIPDTSGISDDLLKVTNTTKSEVLFVNLILKMLRLNGKAAVIVPDGVVNNKPKAFKAIRKELVENHKLEAVISMPSGVFKPYAGASTAVLLFTKTGNGGTDNVWFYDMTADGRTLDDKRTPIDDNDIPDIIERFNNLEGEKDRTRLDKSFLVPKSEIVDNDYSLIINDYKGFHYVPEQLPPSEELVKRADQLVNELVEEMSKLKELL